MNSYNFKYLITILVWISSVGQNISQSINTIATWLNPEYFLNQSEANVSSSVVENRLIRVAVEQWKPHVTIHELGNGSIAISGPMAKLLDSLAFNYNFRYKLIRSTDGLWGAPNDDGSWKGMIGMVMRDEADIALGPFGLTASRASVVKFSNPVIIDYYRILLKRNRPVADPWSFLKPFGPLVWLGIVVSFFVVTFIMAYSLVRLGFDMFKESKSHNLFSKYPNEMEYYEEDENLALTGMKTFMRTFWNLYALFMQQSIIWTNRDNIILGVFGIWLMAALVLMRTYSSGLTSLLAVRTVPVEITGLEDLIKKSKLELILEDSTALTEYLSKVTTGLYGSLAAEAHRTVTFKSNILFESGDAAVREGTSALLVEETSCMVIYSTSFTDRGTCEFILAKEPFWPLVFCIIGQHGSPLIDIFNSQIRSLVEHDFYNRWIGEEVSNFTSCLKAPTSFTITEPYNINSIWGMFFILGCGLLASITVFLFELIVTHIH